jgi:hypothetical protein
MENIWPTIKVWRADAASKFLSSLISPNYPRKGNEKKGDVIKLMAHGRVLV